MAALYRDWVAEATTRGLVADTVDDLLSRLGPHFILATDKDGCIVGFAIAEVSSEYLCIFPAARTIWFCMIYMSLPIVGDKVLVLDS
ncbi:MAG: hypothetical protein OXH39_16590 [Candidatus Poribacteria bacterium]|nr:hypothetical protein [Candidatus Poribacteria bacterium]